MHLLFAKGKYIFKFFLCGVALIYCYYYFYFQLSNIYKQVSNTIFTHPFLFVCGLQNKNSLCHRLCIKYAETINFIIHIPMQIFRSCCSFSLCWLFSGMMRFININWYNLLKNSVSKIFHIDPASILYSYLSNHLK